MKRILILCIVLLCLVPFVSAWTTVWPNETLSYYDGVKLRTDYFPVPSSQSTEICTAYGETVYSPYWYAGFRNKTTGSWYVNQYDPYSFPYNHSILTDYGGPFGLNNGTYDSIAYVASCTPGPGTYTVYRMYKYYNSSADLPPPTANFTAAPLNATAPAYVAFTDTSENETGTCTYNWSFTPADGVLAAPQDLDNEDITILFTENGDFTISHGVSCDAGSNISTKTDYIHIYNATALSTLRIRAVDMLSGYGINGAQVDVFDVENSSWTNQTSVTGEVTVTALNGHTLNAYGSATGYEDGESLALPAVQGELYPIYMNPTDMPGNVSAGNVTVYVTVFEDGTNTRLPGYAVSLTGPSSGGADFTSGVTNENGVFTAVVKNQTNYNVKVLAQKGHLGANKNFNSGNQSGGDSYVVVELWLGVNSITTAPTATTLPGGGTPTPQVTYLPHCDPSAADYDEALCRASKGGVGLNILADYMDDLILLCIFVTIMYLLGFKLGG